jgi:hypothetical protein
MSLLGFRSLAEEKAGAAWGNLGQEMLEAKAAEQEGLGPTEPGVIQR